jgi:hypothetical protein
MDYRGSKSVSLINTVKEQRVDGSYSNYKSELRYTLMGFERNYQISNPSNQFFIQIRDFGTISNNLELQNSNSILLSPDSTDSSSSSVINDKINP